MNRSEYQEYLASREWALLREAVRRRAGGACERCYRNEMQSTHHLTYERVGHERLEDLQGLCEPCHEFLSGKSNTDPRTEGIKVYLAGPIRGNGWREAILTCSGASEIDIMRNSVSDTDAPWPIARRGLLGGFDFTGPWFVDTWGGHGREWTPGDHGFVDAGGHGDDELASRSLAIRQCLRAIEASDIVWAWILDLGEVPAGTLWELGYAAARGKYTIVATPPEIHDELWFPRMAGCAWSCSNSVNEAWEKGLIGYHLDNFLRDRQFVDPYKVPF